MTPVVTTPAAVRPVLAVRDLAVSFPSEAGPVPAVRGLTFTVYPGHTLCIVGESGAGKSVTSLAVTGLLPEQSTVTGSVRLGERELLGLGDQQFSAIRGREIGMIVQDTSSALTPIFTVGHHLIEALLIHQDIGRDAAAQRAVELLDLVGVPNPRNRMRSFPPEFSGGMRQRVVIAAAIANNPRLIIADEPTSSLDVTVQAQVMDVLEVAKAETGAAVILITHDLGLVAGAADDVLVMYAGRAVETGSAAELFAHPRMPYTIGLMGAVPRVDEARPLIPISGHPPPAVQRPRGCPFRPRCPIAVAACAEQEPELVALAVSSTQAAACLRAGQIEHGMIDGRPVHPLPPHSGPTGCAPGPDRPVVLRVDRLGKSYPLRTGPLFGRRSGSVRAVSEVSFDLRAGEALGLVGESGCGKTSTLLAIMALREPEQGRITVVGVDVAGHRNRVAERGLRRRIQMVFQDPVAALDPRMTVFDILAEPLRAAGERRRDALTRRVGELMDLVELDPAHSDRFPVAFSGGQRQRIGIARAIATSPEVVVLDEPVSALDVSIRAGVINLLNRLRAELGLSYLFVAHDLAVVRHVVDRVAVMYLGRIVEIGGVVQVFDDPRHPYTQAQLAAVPVPDPGIERTKPRIRLPGEPPTTADSLRGCGFRHRCPLRPTLDHDRRTRCAEQPPPLAATNTTDHLAACHFR